MKLIQVCRAPVGDGGEGGGGINPDAFAGETLGGRYLIERRLGQSKIGVVFRADDREGDRSVAVKILIPAFDPESTEAEAFVQDIEVMSRTVSPGLLKVMDVGVFAEKYVFMVEPLLAGQSLASRLERDGALPARAAVRVAREVVNALRVLHHHEVLHLNLKPENVFLVRDALDTERTLVSGVGLRHALRLDQAPETNDGECLARPEYVAPEVVTGRALGPHSDIYLVGLLLYEMLTGRPLFIGSQFKKTAKRHVLERPLSPRFVRKNAQIPVGLEKIVMRCLEKTPKKRFPDAESLSEALEMVAQETEGAFTTTQRFRAAKGRQSAKPSARPPEPAPEPAEEEAPQVEPAKTEKDEPAADPPSKGESESKATPSEDASGEEESTRDTLAASGPSSDDDADNGETKEDDDGAKDQEGESEKDAAKAKDSEDEADAAEGEAKDGEDEEPGVFTKTLINMPLPKVEALREKVKDKDEKKDGEKADDESSSGTPETTQVDMPAVKVGSSTADGEDPNDDDDLTQDLGGADTPEARANTAPLPTIGGGKSDGQKAKLNISQPSHPHISGSGDGGDPSAVSGVGEGWFVDNPTQLEKAQSSFGDYQFEEMPKERNVLPIVLGVLFTIVVAGFIWKGSSGDSETPTDGDAGTKTLRVAIGQKATPAPVDAAVKAVVDAARSAADAAAPAGESKEGLETQAQAALASRSWDGNKQALKPVLERLRALEPANAVAKEVSQKGADQLLSEARKALTAGTKDAALEQARMALAISPGHAAALAMIQEVNTQAAASAALAEDAKKKAAEDAKKKAAEDAKKKADEETAKKKAADDAKKAADDAKKKAADDAKKKAADDAKKKAADDAKKKAAENAKKKAAEDAKKKSAAKKAAAEKAKLAAAAKAKAAEDRKARAAAQKEAAAAKKKANAAKRAAATMQANKLIKEGEGHLAAGRWGAARTSFQAALAKNSRSARARAGLGRAAFQQKKFAEAAENYLKATKLNKRNAEYEVQLGMAYFKQKKYKDAKTRWERALSLKPGHAKATKYLKIVQKKL